MTAVVEAANPIDIDRCKTFHKLVENHVQRTSRLPEAAILSHVMVKIVWYQSGLSGVHALQAVDLASTVGVVTSFACEASMGLAVPWSLG